MRKTEIHTKVSLTLNESHNSNNNSNNITENITFDMKDTCPACNNGILGLYYLNLNDTILLCSNPNCIYPLQMDLEKYIQSKDEKELDIDLNDIDELWGDEEI